MTTPMAAAIPCRRTGRSGPAIALHQSPAVFDGGDWLRYAVLPLQTRQIWYRACVDKSVSKYARAGLSHCARFALFIGSIIIDSRLSHRRVSHIAWPFQSSPGNRRHQAAAASHIQTDSTQSYLQWRRRLWNITVNELFYILQQNQFP